MAQQCRQFLPELAVMATQEAAEQLSQEIKDLPIRVNWGEAGLIEAATMEKADCVITAVVGMVGLKPTLAAIRAGKRIGLANKETLVCAGEIVMAEAEAYGTEIIPVDSEHSAIFQCLMGSGEKNANHPASTGVFFKRIDSFSLVSVPFGMGFSSRC
jgi:1-deoxy-D-xylulose-5-phosphate reductoisomerase